MAATKSLLGMVVSTWCVPNAFRSALVLSQPAVTCPFVILYLVQMSLMAETHPKIPPSSLRYEFWSAGSPGTQFDPVNPGVSIVTC